MRRITLKSILFKSLRTLLLIGVLVYLLFLWKLKTGVDAYFDQKPAGLTIEYSWLWAKWDGSLFLTDLKVFDHNVGQIGSIGKIQVQFHSLANLLSLDRYVTYQELPRHVLVSMRGAATSENFKLFDYLRHLNIPFSQALLPSQCHAHLFQSPEPFQFELTGEFSHQEFDEILSFDLDFQSISLADFTLTGKVNDISSENLASGYIGEMTFRAKEMVWLQQALNRCREATGLTQNDRLAQVFRQQLNATAQSAQYQLSESLLNRYQAFVHYPDDFALSFSPAQGYYWGRLAQQPLHEIEANSDLFIQFNGHTVDQIFAAVGAVGFLDNKNQAAAETLQQPARSYLPVSYRGLQGFVGTAVTVYLKNQTAVKGVIEKVTPKRIFISEYRYGGKSELPYDYREIDTIEVTDKQKR